MTQTRLRDISRYTLPLWLTLGCGGAPDRPAEIPVDSRAWCTSTARLEVPAAASDAVVLVASQDTLHLVHAESDDMLVWTTLDLRTDGIDQRRIPAPFETARPLVGATRDDGIAVGVRTRDGRRVTFLRLDAGDPSSFGIEFAAEPGERVRAALSADGRHAAGFTEGLDAVARVPLDAPDGPVATSAMPVAAGPTTLWLDSEWTLVTGRFADDASSIRAWMWKHRDDATLTVDTGLTLAAGESLVDQTFDDEGRNAALVRTGEQLWLRQSLVGDDGVLDVSEEAVADGLRFVGWVDGRPVVSLPGVDLASLVLRDDLPRDAWIRPGDLPLAQARTTDGEVWVVDGRVQDDGRWTLATHRLRCASP